MRSPLHSSYPPFTLPSNIVYFHDWRYVDPGASGGQTGFAWVDEQGNRPPLWGTGGPVRARFEAKHVPRGVRLVAKEADKVGPVITAGGDAGEFLDHGRCTVIHEDGMYRLWHEGYVVDASPREGWKPEYNILRYAESDNGMDWSFPELGVFEHKGSRENNIVYGGPSTSWYHGGSVFRDPVAPPEERYKLFYMGSVSPDALAKYRRERPDEVDPNPFGGESYNGIFGAVSPDGIQWTPLPDPLVIQTSDTQNVCTYDVALGKYVAYVRSWCFFRRGIGRMETDDFRRFPICEEVFWPDAMCEASELWYANAKTIVPDTTDYHVMFPLRWDLTDDRWDFRMATSPDGIVWGFVPGGPVCRPSGVEGSWDSALVAPSVGMVRLPGGKMAIPMGGWPVPHKYPRRPPMGGIGWACWPEGRLVALQAPSEGAFSLFPIKFKGREIHLNFRTSRAGYVKVEAIDHEGKVIDGRGMGDCDYLSGDRLDQLVTWRGMSDIGHSDGSPAVLRFQLYSAELYSVKFV